MYTNIMHGGSALRVTTNNTVDLDVAKYVQGGNLVLTIHINAGVLLSGFTRTGRTSVEGWTEQGAIYSSVPVVAAGSLVRIINYGDIWGCNGAGGDAGYSPKAGEKGQTAIQLPCPLYIRNFGTIHGGGGGGGSGAGPVGTDGGGGGYPGGYSDFSFPSRPTESRLYLSTGLNTGGDCYGHSQAGESSSTAGGAIGNAINASGEAVTVINGSAGILGDTV